MGTRGQWARDMLRALGNGSPTERTINLVAAWTAAEGTKARFNPLGTKFDHGETTNHNSEGVKNYKTRSQGIQATVLTLQGNHEGYEDIRGGLRSNDPERALRGMYRNKWGTNFKTVEDAWRQRDLTGEALLSEASSAPEGNPGTTPGSPNTPRPPASGDAAAHIGEQNPIWGDGSGTIGGPVSSDNVRTALKVIGGGVLLFVGLIIGYKELAKLAGIPEMVQAVVPAGQAKTLAGRFK